jgi:hypothetical protein
MTLLYTAIPLGYGAVILILVWYVYKEVTIPMKAVWKCTVMGNGVSYVGIP